MIYMTSLLISLFITITLIPIFRKAALHLHAVDFPNERKIHDHPMPKSGGLAIAIGTLVPILLLSKADQFLVAISVGSLVLVIFGMVDDFKDLSYGVKFIGQAAAALIVIFIGGLEIRSLGMLLPDGVVLPHWVSIPLTLVVIVGVTNAINLSDGLDGLAGGISLLSFMLIGYLAYQAENILVALLCCGVLGSIFAFLRFNTYPAVIFMGDAGSQFLGFLAVTLALQVTQVNAPLSPLLPLVILGFPVLDTMTVMAERISNGHSPFMPDKNHFHHKLLRLGLFHTEAVVAIYLVQGFLVTVGYVFRFYSDWFLLVFYLAFSTLVLTGFFVAEKTNWRLKRFEVFDKIVKGRLRVLKDKSILIKVSFKSMEVLFPAIFLTACVLPGSVSSVIGIVLLIFAALIFAVYFSNKRRLYLVLRVCFYLSVPFLVFIGDEALQTGPARLRAVYTLLYAGLAFLALVTLKFTRRQKGFKASPMDFLILILALTIPNLPESIQGYHLGGIAVKVIVLFFGFEVLMGELRGEFRWLALPIAAGLAFVGLKGLVM